MKKSIRIAHIVLFVLLCGQLSAQYKYALPAVTHKAALAYEMGILKGSVAIKHFNYNLLATDSSKTLELHLEGYYKSAEAGKPALPIYSKLVEVSPENSYRIKIDRIDSTIIDLKREFRGYKMALTEASNQKGTGNQSTDFNSAAQNTEILTASNGMLSLHNEGKMRGVSIGRLEIRPFRYDPLKHILIVYHQLEFILVPLVYPESQLSRMQSFDHERLLSNVIRPAESQKKRIVQEMPLTMVILSDTLFKESLQNLITWKKRKGFKIIEAYTSDPAVGKTNTEIKQYLKQLYEEPPAGIAPPSFLMIVGDVEHVPLSQSSGQITDLYYTTYDGADDYLPELFHGRISAKDTTELNAIIDKILMYEQYTFPDPSYLDRSILIAGYDGSYASLHGNGQIRYASSYYFNEENNIEAKVYLHPEASSLDHTILGDIRQGAAVVNYTGHGEYYGWLNPAFRLHHIDTLGNTHKYSLMIGNGCSTNQFNMSSQDCFAEAVVKVPEQGAIGYIGCTNDSYWDEDYYWAVGVGEISRYPEYEESSPGFYDKVFHKGNEAVDDWAPSLGEMIYAGNMTVQESDSDRKRYYWEIYQITGDPSLVPWFRQAGEMEANYPDYIPEPASQLRIEVSPYYYVAISVDGQLVSAKHADKYGEAFFILPDSISSKDMELLISGDQHQPLIDTIRRLTLDKPYIELLHSELSNESIEDALITQEELFSLDFTIQNSGGAALENVELLLESISSDIQVLDSIYSLNFLGAGDSVEIEEAFRIQVAGSVSDSTEVLFLIRSQEKGLTNAVSLKYYIRAPVLISNSIVWEDRIFGNADGIIRSGEKIELLWSLSNKGSYLFQTENLNIELLEESVLTSLDYSRKLRLASLDDTIHLLETLIAESIPEGSYHATVIINDGPTETKDSVFIALDRHFEDFSSGDLSRFKWLNGASPWLTDHANFETGPFAIRSGNIGNHGRSSLSVNLSLESEDVLSFFLKTSTEVDYDYLVFYIDSIEVERWSGYTDWMQFETSIDSGMHLLEWRYEKDKNTSKGEDAVWIDNVVFPQGVFSQTDMGIIALDYPESGPTMGSEEHPRIRVRNTGQTDIDSFEIGIKVDSHPWYSQTFEEELLAGQQLQVTLDTSFDFSGLRNYDILMGVSCLQDMYPGNDSLHLSLEHVLFNDLEFKSLAFHSDSITYASLDLRFVNIGNVPVSSLSYQFYLNDVYIGTYPFDIELNPGENHSFVHFLNDVPDSVLIEGENFYSLFIKDDYNNGNNVVMGDFFWKTKSIHTDHSKVFRVYPNPAIQFLNLDLSGDHNYPIICNLISLEGKVLAEMEIRSGSSILQLPRGNKADFVILVLKSLRGEVLYSEKIRIAEGED